MHVLVVGGAGYIGSVTVAELLAAGGRLPRSQPRVKDIEQCRMDLARLRQVVSVPEALVPAAAQLADPPASVVAQVGPAIEQEGRSPELARSLISHLLALRERFCPRFDELAPGQLAAVALDVRDRRMSRKMRLRARLRSQRHTQPLQAEEETVILEST